MTRPQLIASLTEATRQLNGLIRYRRDAKQKGLVKEASIMASEEDPFLDDFGDQLLPLTLDS